MIFNRLWAFPLDIVNHASEDGKYIWIMFISSMCESCDNRLRSFWSWYYVALIYLHVSLCYGDLIIFFSMGNFLLSPTITRLQPWWYVMTILKALKKYWDSNFLINEYSRPLWNNPVCWYAWTLGLVISKDTVRGFGGAFVSNWGLRIQLGRRHYSLSTGKVMYSWSCYYNDVSHTISLRQGITLWSSDAWIGTAMRVFSAAKWTAKVELLSYIAK